MIRPVAIALLLLGAAPLAGAQLYKYVDKDGKTVYSDQPPPNVESKQLNIQSAPSTANAPKSAVEKDKELEKVRKAARDKAKKADEVERVAKVNAENCKIATANYKQYEAGGRIGEINDKGERELLDDKTLETRREKARADMDEACKGQ